MTHVLVIVALASLVLRDEVGLPWSPPASHPAAAVILLGTLAAVWALAHAVIWRLGRAMDTSGSVAAVRSADATLAWSRAVGALVHVAAVFGLGWLDAVRAAIGNLVLLDEAAAALPYIALLCAGWWSIHPIERRLREAVLIRRLDHGLSVHPIPTRVAFVFGAARQQLAVVLVPVLLILAWSEGARWVMESMGWPRVTPPPWAGDRAWSQIRLLALPAAQLVGVIGVFALAPVLLRRVWDTVRLGPGELRDSIVEICRGAGVRVRELLVWRTGGTMVNGAVIGLIPAARYILLTDALLEMLTPGQVRAVAAHEVAHVRRRHMLWLAIVVLTAVFGCAMLVQWGIRQWGGEEPACAQGLGAALSLAFGLAVFGPASRRFERQADAFAVARLSGHRDGPGGAAVVSPESVAEMTGALQAVADLNHVPLERFSWRHGSIADRQRRLARLAWQRTDRLDADIAAARVKRLAAIGLILVLAGVAADAGLW